MRKPRLREVVIVAPFLVWAGWDSFKDLEALEENGGSMWVGKTTKFLYDLGGKWGVLIGVWGLVAAYLYVVWRTYKREREERAAQAPATKTANRAPQPKRPPHPVRADHRWESPSQPMPQPPPPRAQPIVVMPPPLPQPPGHEPSFLR